MMKNRKSKQGFGMAEAIVGMLASSILALTIGSLLYFGWLSWSRSNSAIEMQRDASLAMRIMAKEIRNSTDTTVGTSTLVCQNPSNTVRFTRSGSDLAMAVDGNLQLYLVRGAVASFSTASTNINGVVVNLNLSINSDSARLREVTYPRN